ncbi:hypothetical protein [Brevundimonas lenta]|uniref:Uncharacterized protein n=1 Tax=Brevundimonas lenta TaxID=424796 RepID=A0A7W6NRK3_9CAUL|nr:hypothetical protein [Brevundimonas lenta]MBB4084362.1 hypothetical protein [Brevundimonas lenta]
MKMREPMPLVWGLVLIGGAFWVRFGLGHESWVNWMMGAAGVLMIGWWLLLQRRRDR